MSVYYGDTTCHDPRKCFAKGDFGGCSLLLDTYPEGVPCKFCKPRRDQTGDKIYPANRTYEKPWLSVHHGDVLGLRGTRKGSKK